MKKKAHKIYNGDCLKLLKKLPKESVDLIITDPPYNIGLKYVKKYFSDRKKTHEYVMWLAERIKACDRVLKKNGTMYLINYPELNARILPLIEDETGLELKRWIVWNYPTNIGHSKKNWTRSHRSILYFVKGKNYTFNRQHIIQHYKNPNVTKIKKRIENGSKGRNAYDVLRFLDVIEMHGGMIDVQEINLCKNTAKTRKNGHPCQLPLSLLETLIKVSSNKQDVVLDPFAGTFSLSEAAKKLNRRSIGIEIAKKYCNIGKRRLKENEPI
jgi:DNA modification methylase